ncbi:MAG: T9SS C-terminal target domain-containing protein [Calditrichaeota bacterium]|nr:MAG: T9SS C-terminal target domain-containing protein [Calditrichota bacterium]
MKFLCVVILFISICFVNVHAAEPYRGLVRDFVGINSNVGAYDAQIVGRLAKVALWMREYHRWEFYEQKENVYGWDDKTPAFNGGSWPFHTKFVQECVKNQINMVICTERSTEWASVNGEWNGPPYRDSDGTTEADYRDKAEFIAQMVARYGAQKVDAEQLQTADKLSGLNVVHYYEDENEPDQWWWQPTWPAPLYAQYLNAVHDGYNVPPMEEYPLIGIKNVDSTAVHVLGGVTGSDISYLDQIMLNTDGRTPFDIINFHHYCTSGSSARPPEDEQYGLEKICAAFLNWRDKHTPGLPVWCSEFGWDTFKSTQGASSYVYATEQSQANYLLRSIFLLMSYGLEKAFVFFDVDPSSEDATQYSSSGIMTDKNHGLRPKISFYYLATLQNLVGDYSFDHVHSYRQGNPEVYAFALKSSTESNKFCYVVWCRKAKARADEGAVLTDYRFALPGIQAASVFEPVNQNEFGQEVMATLESPGSENSSILLPQLSEKPLFIFVTLDPTSSVSSNHRTPQEFGLAAFPNPFNSSVTIEVILSREDDVNLSLYDISGRLVRQHRQYWGAGRQCMRMDFKDENLSTGVYLLDLQSGDIRRQQKICYIR